MKKLMSILCAAAMACSVAACGAAPKPPAVVRSFLAGYEDAGDESSSRVLLNLMSDGTAEIYVGMLDQGKHSTAVYTGTYTLGENEEYDETISLVFADAEGNTAEITDAVIVDGIFEASLWNEQEWKTAN